MGGEGGELLFLLLSQPELNPGITGLLPDKDLGAILYNEFDYPPFTSVADIDGMGWKVVIFIFPSSGGVGLAALATVGGNDIPLHLPPTALPAPFLTPYSFLHLPACQIRVVGEG